MSRGVLIIGDSGNGKSTSLESLDPQSTFLINVAGKALPFKGWRAKYTMYDPSTKTGNLFTTADAGMVLTVMNGVSEKMPHIKTLVIDDAQYVMGFEFMERAKEKGFEKFTEIGQGFFNILNTANKLRDDLVVIILSHSEDVSGNGYTKTKMKTIGKMLDEKITPEGLFTIVLQAVARVENKEVKYYFVTQTDGTTTVKTPRGMFKDRYIPNNMRFVLDAIHTYDSAN